MPRFLTTRLIVLGIAAILLGPPSRAAERFPEFVHITDSHVMDLTGVRPELVKLHKHYAHSALTLPEFLSRKRPVAFVPATGDLVDAFCFESARGGDVCGQLDRFKSIHRRYAHGMAEQLQVLPERHVLQLPEESRADVLPVPGAR